MTPKAPLTLAVLAALLLFTTASDIATAAEPPSAQALWARNMGQSGLRRFYATGADLGELVNRQVSYQTANRLATARLAANPAAAVTPAALASEASGYVGQYDSLMKLPVSLQQPLFLRTLARTAKRLESDKLHSSNDRYDLGLLYAPSQNSYAGLGIAVEATSADLKYVSGATELNAVGPRFDAGLRLNPVFALGIRAEQLQFSGDNVVTSRGTTVSRELDYRRRYLQVEAIARLSTQQWQVLPAWLQVGGMVAMHALDTRYESQLNSLGQPVREPFGNNERLMLLRSGLFASATLGARRQWNPYAELLIDREIDNNMTKPLDDRTGAILRTGVAWLPVTGKRLSLEYQRSQSRDRLRERNNLLFVVIQDF